MARHLRKMAPLSLRPWPHHPEQPLRPYPPAQGADDSSGLQGWRQPGVELESRQTRVQTPTLPRHSSATSGKGLGVSDVKDRSHCEVRTVSVAARRAQQLSAHVLLSDPGALWHPQPSHPLPVPHLLPLLCAAPLHPASGPTLQHWTTPRVLKCTVRPLSCRVVSGSSAASCALAESKALGPTFRSAPENRAKLQTPTSGEAARRGSRGSLGLREPRGKATHPREGLALPACLHDGATGQSPGLRGSNWGCQFKGSCCHAQA